MATKLIAQVFGKPERNKVQGEQGMLNSLLGMLDNEKMMKQMLNSHAPNDDSDVDVHSLFALVENTLKGASAIADSVVNNHHKGMGTSAAAPPNAVEYKAVKEGFNPPLQDISEVTCQITCKAVETKNVKETMVGLFQELSGYSWVGKAVVSLSALAIYYADFWRLAQFEPNDKLIESISILKGLPAITKPADSQKIQVFGVLNEMIKVTLEMTSFIVEFEQDSKDVPELSTAIDISTTVIQIIISILACSIQFTTLISVVDESKGRELPTFSRKVNLIHHTIKTQLEDFKHKKGEIREYQRLQRLFNAPTDNVELIKALFYTKDTPEQPLFLGSKKTTDKMECLRRKNVLLLISDLNLSPTDLSILVNIYKEPLFHEKQYDIMWVPIVDREEIDRDETVKRFESLRSQMPWYSVHSPSVVNKIAVRIIKEKWHFRQDQSHPFVVVLDPQGKVVCQNATNMIRMWGFQSFPFTDEVVANIWKKRDISWFHLLVNDCVTLKEQEAMKSDKLIFVYGGESEKEVHELEQNIKKISEEGTPMLMVNVSKTQLFWTRLESCIFSMMQAKTDMFDPLMQDVLKVYTSFKKDGGFAVLAKGTRVVLNGSLTAVTKVVSQYDAEWKKHVNNLHGKTFDVVLKEHHDKTVPQQACHYFYIPNMVGHIPDNLNCPTCTRVMKNIVKFECCHGAH